MSRTDRRRAFRVLVLAVALLFGACAAPSSGLLPPPTVTSSTSIGPTTTPIDYSQIALERFPGETTTTVPLETGDATLRGGVTGPEGPLPGATVRIERLVGDAVQRLDIGTDETGQFVAAGVPGGRFRVRAFLAPQLTMLTPDVFFLADGDTRDLDLRPELFDGRVAVSATTPAEPIVGDGVNLAVRIADRSVDADGIGREVPVAGVPVELSVSGWSRLDGEPQDPPAEPGDEEVDDESEVPAVRVTDGNGVIVFELRCDRVTATSATVKVPGLPPPPDENGEQAEAVDVTVDLQVPPCSPVPTTTTEAPEGEGGGGGGEGDG